MHVKLFKSLGAVLNGAGREGVREGGVEIASRCAMPNLLQTRHFPHSCHSRVQLPPIVASTCDHTKMLWHEVVVHAGQGFA
jgi:hypothetical protein